MKDSESLYVNNTSSLVMTNLSDVNSKIEELSKCFVEYEIDSNKKIEEATILAEYNESRIEENKKLLEENKNKIDVIISKLEKRCKKLFYISMMATVFGVIGTALSILLVWGVIK